MEKIPQTGSSGLDTDARNAMTEEKKRKRIIANRESARRSRMKKQKHMEETIHEISILETNIKENKNKCRIVNQSLVAIQSQNVVLMSEKTRLSNYLENLEMITKSSTTQSSDQNAETAFGECRRPWSVQLGSSVSSDGYGSVQPVMASRLSRT